MKRYNTEAEILEAIESCYKKAAELTTKADEIDKECVELRHFYGTSEQIAYKRLEEKRLRGKSFRLLNVKAKKLGEKLSEFRTSQLPALDNHDPSIPA